MVGLRELAKHMQGVNQLNLLSKNILQISRFSMQAWCCAVHRFSHAWYLCREAGSCLPSSVPPAFVERVAHLLDQAWYLLMVRRSERTAVWPGALHMHGDIPVGTGTGLRLRILRAKPVEQHDHGGTQAERSVRGPVLR